MPAEIPEPVAAATGAETVNFPWLQAEELVTALRDAADTLNAQMWLRPAMIVTIGDWQGAFRDEFDEAYTRLTGIAPDIVGSVVSRASSVAGRAEDANAEQQLANERVARSAATGTPVP